MSEVFLELGAFGGRTSVQSRFEADVYECEVIGQIPAELNGTLYRTGGDREFPTLQGDHILNGDGLFSMFRFENGHVSFRSRFVKTERLLRERAARRRLYGSYRNPFTDDPCVAGTDRDNTGNTQAFYHHGVLYALREDSYPYRIDPDTLDTRPPDDFGGKLRSRTTTAHPKIDPTNGEWWAIGLFAAKSPYRDMSLHVFDRDGELIREEWFEMPHSGLTHDWAVTREHCVFPIMPLVVDEDQMKAGGSFYTYDPDVPSRWGVMPRNGTVDEIRWFEVPGIVIGHVMNAFSEGDIVHIDATVAQGNLYTFLPTVSGEPSLVEKGRTQITRVSIDLTKEGPGAVTMQPFTCAYGDMPRFDERYAMSRYTQGYFALRAAPLFGIGQLDWGTGKLKVHAEQGVVAQEPVFVPRSHDAPEGDGFVLSVVNRKDENRADLLVLDGRDVSRAPIATVRLPFNLPFSFHGCFVSAP